MKKLVIILILCLFATSCVAGVPACYSFTGSYQGAQGTVTACYNQQESAVQGVPVHDIAGVKNVSMPLAELKDINQKLENKIMEDNGVNAADVSEKLKFKRQLRNEPSDYKKFILLKNYIN